MSESDNSVSGREPTVVIETNASSSKSVNANTAMLRPKPGVRRHRGAGAGETARNRE